MLDFEDSFYSDKVKLIVGVDEAGRGPLCGPVVAGCCILPRDYKNEEINDSKKLTEKKREKLFLEIKEHAIAYGIGIVDAETIDKINIYEAARKAMLLAIENMNHEFDLCLSDAMPLNLGNIETIPIIKGDAKCECIAAGSILAKVTRDHIMYEYAKKYPEYHFEKNKGYGTKVHLEALKKYGAIKGLHRFSYGPVRDLNIEQLKIF